VVAHARRAHCLPLPPDRERPVVAAEGEVLAQRAEPCEDVPREEVADESSVGRLRLVPAKLLGVLGRAGEAVSPMVYVVSLNLHRRHLTAEQRRDDVAALFKDNPKQSNRKVAEKVGVDHKTVGTVRQQLESTGEIPQLSQTEGKDGKARPARKEGTGAQAMNLHRRHLNSSQKGMVAARAREIYDRQAKERQREGQERGRKSQKGFPENLPETDPRKGDARDQAGKAVGVSGRTVDHATKDR
jgi:transposase